MEYATPTEAWLLIAAGVALALAYGAAWLWAALLETEPDDYPLSREAKLNTRRDGFWE